MNDANTAQPPLDTPQREFSSSVMSYITVSLVTIIAITLVSIFISFWVTELADKDAQAINLSGSMRMQTYRIGLDLVRANYQQANVGIQKLHETWNHPIFSAQHAQFAHPQSKHASALSKLFNRSYEYWLHTVKPQLEQAAIQHQTPKNIEQLLEVQVSLTDALVNEFQIAAERKIVNLRSFQLVVLLITVLVGSLIFYLLKNRIEKPLSVLTETAENIRQGDLSQQVPVTSNDELGLLATTFNRMTRSIADAYGVLEERVEQRTSALQQNNIALEFLFSTARNILESLNGDFCFADTLAKLSEVIGGHSLELCLFTEQGEHPYLQLVSNNNQRALCEHGNCKDCRNLQRTAESLVLPGHQRFPIIMGGRNYGVIDLHLQQPQPLPEWQINLIQSVANQFAIALSMSEQKDRDNRFIMLSERTVIARELHDSLAQALSYLQIQVTRLQKSKDKQKYELQQAIIDELREGLSSAYRQLRELLTTFRLKMDEGGLKAALEHTVSHLRERSNMKITLAYHLEDLPLAASEEIHLLQIVREAGQNAIYHSKGSNLVIHLHQNTDKQVVLEVTDDGIGIPDSPEKLNHYGLAIMNERSRNLGGMIEIHSQPGGGTRVSFSFIPSINQQR